MRCAPHYSNSNSNSSNLEVFGRVQKIFLEPVWKFELWVQSNQAFLWYHDPEAAKAVFETMDQTPWPHDTSRYIGINYARNEWQHDRWTSEV